MYTLTEMNELTGRELVQIHNGLVAEEAQIGQWKAAKSKLIEKIIALGFEPEAEEVTPKGAIKRKAIELLTTTVGSVDRKTGNPSDSDDASTVYTVGLSYKAVLRELLEVYPDAKTTLACLRWYAVKLRNEEEGYEGYTLPQKRPQERSK